MAEKSKPMTLAKERKAVPPINLNPRPDLFTEIQRVHNAIVNRAREIFEATGRLSGRELANWLEAESELLHPVHIDLAESGEELVLRAEVPGFTAKELEITLEGRRATIAGNRQSRGAQSGKTLRSECCSDRILRVVELPMDVLRDKATATLEDGVLEIILPKAAPPRKIPISPNVASGLPTI
jgi:HSP20 family protein